MPGWTNTWKRGWRYKTGNIADDWNAAEKARTGLSEEFKIVAPMIIFLAICIVAGVNRDAIIAFLG